ncbi:dihydrolipoyl dehydrogenase [Lentibacillus saliphilus]|uniref:dihydrolipoyl dehydrogenase n=1 Tax=Lentibacillus saliphilus TaxID=2737028 RepID=UPI001C30101F|nr:dihydrolipoyl dehydrogenase [Lentibacillus saliphilus]
MQIKMSIIPGGNTGIVGEIHVSLGSQVSAGDTLMEVEISKGNLEITAEESGIISRILVEEGSEVSSNDVLVEMEPMQSNGIEAKGDQHALNEEMPTEDIDTDLLIIGAGPGGYVAAIYAAKKGLRVTLVEKEKTLGGTCLNVGCIPTKSLVKSSEVCHSVKNSGLFGIETDSSLQVNMKQMIRRKEDVVDQLVSGISFLMEKNDIPVIHGDASFLSENKVLVTGKNRYDITAKDIIIATGSKISKVNIPGIDLPFVMNSTDALSCTELPKSITIIGGGVIGMEFAFIYRNLGVDVHVVEFMDRLLSMLDSDLTDELEQEAEQAGIHVHTGAKVSKIQKAHNGEAIVTYETASGEELLVSEKVLVAIGREPNIDGLGLDQAGVQLVEDGKGIAVDKQMRTNVEHIYAIGDVTNIMQLAHVASHQGIHAVDAILGAQSEMDYTAVPNVIFTSPEIANVGLQEYECEAQGIDYQVSKVSFASNGKALTMNEPAGFIKLIKDNQSGQIIGGAIIGPDASSLISSLTIAISNKLTEQQITQTIFAHPTTAEVIHEAALGLSIGALHEA